MSAAAILDFQKFKFLMADTLERPNLHHSAKFHQDRSIRCGDMTIFYFSRWRRPPSWILKIAILNVLWQK